MFESAIEMLQRGQTVVIRPRGNSMSPAIKSRQRVRLEPVTEETVLKARDIVLAKVGRLVYLHRVKAIEGQRVLIANNFGRVNGWTHRRHVYGRVIRST